MTEATSRLDRKDIRRFMVRRMLGPVDRYLLEDPTIALANSLIYSKLANIRDQDFLRGGQAYALVNGTPETVYIHAYEKTTGEVGLVTPFSDDPDAGTIEIIDNRATFEQLHHCIDMAIAELSRTAFDDQTDDSLMVEDDRVLYDLPEGWVAVKEVVANLSSFANDRYTQHTDQHVSPLLLTATTQRYAQRLTAYAEVRLSQLFLMLRVASGTPTGTIRFRLWSDDPAGGPDAVLVTGSTYDVSNLTNRTRYHQLVLSLPYNLVPTTTYWWELDTSAVVFGGGSIELTANSLSGFQLGSAWTSADGGTTWTETDETICFVAKDDRPRPYVLKSGRRGVWDVQRDVTSQLRFSRRPPGGTQLTLVGQVVQPDLTLDSDVPLIDGGVVRDFATAILAEELAQNNLSSARLAKELRMSAEARAIRLGVKTAGSVVERN